MKNISYIKVNEIPIKRIVNYYDDIGEIHALLDFFIHIYGESASYHTADVRFEKLIEPFLEKMSHDNFVHLLTVSNDNNQIYGRYSSVTANDKIIIRAKDTLGKDFDYSKFEHFEFSKEIPDSSTTPSDENGDEDWEI